MPELVTGLPAMFKQSPSIEAPTLVTVPCWLSIQTFAALAPPPEDSICPELP